MSKVLIKKSPSLLILYVTYSTTHQRSVEVQFGRYQKNILQEGSMVKNLSCVSYGSLKRFPHTFTNVSEKSKAMGVRSVTFYVVD